MQTIPRGDSTKGPADMFTGDLYFDVIAKGEEPSRMRVKHGALRAVRPDRVAQPRARSDPARHRRHRSGPIPRWRGRRHAARRHRVHAAG